MTDMAMQKKVLDCPVAVYGKQGHEHSDDDFHCIVCHPRFQTAELSRAVQNLGAFSWCASGGAERYAPVIQWCRLHDGSYLVACYEDKGCDANHRPHTLRKTHVLLPGYAAQAVWALVSSFSSLELDEVNKVGAICYDASCPQPPEEGVRGDEQTFYLRKASMSDRKSAPSQVVSSASYHDRTSASWSRGPSLGKRKVARIVLGVLLLMVTGGMYWKQWRELQDHRHENRLLSDKLKQSEKRVQKLKKDKVAILKEKASLIERHNYLKEAMRETIDKKEKKLDHMRRLVRESGDQCKQELLECQSELEQQQQLNKNMRRNCARIIRDCKKLESSVHSLEQQLQASPR